MKILWLTNISLPESSELMNELASPYGGWLVNASKKLSEQEGIQLTIVFPKDGVSDSLKLTGEKITYYAFKPVRNRDLSQENINLKRIINEVKPDVVHIYGTEMPHTLSMVNVCNNEKVKCVISIQGLVSICEKHLFANLPWYVVYGNTVGNLLMRDSINRIRKAFIKKGINEVEAIKKVSHVIGRTTWDKACVSQINPNFNYHFCNEILREEFYKHKWDYDKCEKHSIFLSQGSYPIKGLHYFLEALPTIIKKFPNTKVYIGGSDITKSTTLKDKLMMSYYAKYLKNIIDSNNLNEHVIFTGPLNEKEMCERYLKSNVFVCPSSIENSPNSVGEAMILGVPCVASNVGGVPDMLRDKEEGFLYQADAPYMLAHYVCEIFENEDLALKFSKSSRDHALLTHSSEDNTKKLLEIYNEIINS
ncbi:MAG: glycosyl transferase family 1 [Bacillales bacterium]|jgi:glycosyltransferase involved in cell wall biosynthesis|nr:glycosyl transferase family 1 [Bacillales bacterium]